MKSKMQTNYFFEKNGFNVDYIEDFEKLSSCIEEVLDEEYSPLYEGMLFFKVENLSDSQKINLVDLFLDSYFNTAVAKSKFSPEFVTVSGAILQGLVPLKLKYLCVEEIYIDIYNIISNVD